MDEGRYRDLEHLEAVMKDYSKPYSVRERAYWAKQQIVAQLKDRKLCELRRRLIRAVQASDEHAEWQIGNQIKEYVHENHLEIPV